MESTTSNKNNFLLELNFTGNWYIDLGILGLRNLIESSELNYDIKNLSSIEEFRKYVLILLLIDMINIQAKNNLGKVEKEVIEKYKCIFKEYKEKLKKRLEDLLQKKEEEICDEIFKEFQIPFLKEILNKELPSKKQKNESTTYYEFFKKQLKNERLWIDSNFYKNFAFFNTSQKFRKQKENIALFIKEGKILKDKKSTEGKQVEFSKELNKFLPSQEEFDNFFFVPISIQDVRQNYPEIPKDLFYLIFLTLPYAFIKIGETFYSFYSPDKKFTYIVSKKLKAYLEKNIHNESIHNERIINITWASIIDSLVEVKSEWSINNMYLISYQKITNESVEGVEYIGIDKQKARIIIDDEIREKLNTIIIIKDKVWNKSRGKSNTSTNKKWIIMEYIKGNSLFDLVFKYVKSNLEEGKIYKEYKESIFWALAVEGLSKREKNSYEAFYYDKTGPIPDEIKKETREMIEHNNYFSKIVKKQQIYYLLNQIKENKKDKFLNAVLKMLNNFEENFDSKNKLVNYIFNKILYNNVNWQYYALALVLPNGGE